MAVKGKNKKAASEVLSEDTLLRIGGKVIKLLNNNHEDIARYIDQAEDNKLTVGISLGINLAETEPRIDVAIRCSQAITDEDVIPLARSEDPNQPLLIPQTDDENPMDLTSAQEEVMVNAANEGVAPPPTAPVALPKNSKSKRARGK